LRRSRGRRWRCSMCRARRRRGGVRALRDGAGPARPRPRAPYTLPSARDALLSLEIAHQLDRGRGREGADDFAVDPDLGGVVAGAVALAEVEAETVVGRVFAHANAENVLEDEADTRAALDVAGGAAAPGDRCLGRRRQPELGVEGQGTVDSRFGEAEVLRDRRDGIRRHITIVVLDAVEAGEHVAFAR